MDKVVPRAGKHAFTAGPMHIPVSTPDMVAVRGCVSPIPRNSVRASL